MKALTDAAAKLGERPRLAVGIGVVAVCALVAAGLVLRAGLWRGGARDVVAGQVARGMAAEGGPVVGRDGKPMGVVTFAQGCVSAACHGSLRGGGVTHAAGRLVQGCDQCHAADAGGHTYALVAKGATLCLTCHETITNHSPAHEKAMGGDDCLACHAGHGPRGGAAMVAAGGGAKRACLACHVMTEGAVKHGPFAAGRCETCHTPHGERAAEMLLAAGGAKAASVCTACHAGAGYGERMAASPHRELAGGCAACHEPHAAAGKKLLAGPSRAVCLGCHEEISKTIVAAGGKGGSTHGPVMETEGCVRCHDAHGAGGVGGVAGAAMLRGAEPGLCLECHGKPVKMAGGRVIAAMGVAEPGAAHQTGGHSTCSGCHSVHGAVQQHLLAGSNEKLPLGEFDGGKFGLCFGCHDAGLVRVAAATGFRDGERNLHGVHVAGEGTSRGCVACHSTHGEGEPRLMVRKVNYQGSGWGMPMGFVVTEQGGRCGTACHEAMEYSRKAGGARNMKQNGGRP